MLRPTLDKLPQPQRVYPATILMQGLVLGLQAHLVADDEDGLRYRHRDGEVVMRNHDDSTFITVTNGRRGGCPVMTFACQGKNLTVDPQPQYMQGDTGQWVRVLLTALACAD